MYKLVSKVIKDNYPELNPETMRFIFPHWEMAPKAAP